MNICFEQKQTEAKLITLLKIFMQLFLSTVLILEIYLLALYTDIFKSTDQRQTLNKTFRLVYILKIWLFIVLLSQLTVEVDSCPLGGKRRVFNVVVGPHLLRDFLSDMQRSQYWSLSEKD